MYEEYQKSKYWILIQEAISDLEKNKDLELKTNYNYII